MSTESPDKTTSVVPRHRRLIRLVLGLLFAASCAVPVLAQQHDEREPRENHPRMLDEFDADSDGTVSTTEFTTRTQARFAELGADAQPMTPAELKALVQAETALFGPVIRASGIKAD